MAAILTSGFLIVSEFGRWIHDDCPDIFHRLERMLNHLVSASGDLTASVNAYGRAVGKYVRANTPIIIDLTALAKPRTKKMKYLAYLPGNRRALYIVSSRLPGLDEPLIPLNTMVVEDLERAEGWATEF